MTSSVSKSEQSYIKSALQATPALRNDGRGLYDFRHISIETGLAPLANGSARAVVGNDLEVTEVIVAAKLEVEDVDEDEDDLGEGFHTRNESDNGASNGRISFTVAW
jgi:exosome complex component RRP42